MIKIELTTGHFVELIKKSYSLDMLYLIKILDEGQDISELVENNPKIKAIHSTMLRKGIISSENKLTILGVEILEFISKKSNTVFVKKKVEPSDFDKWWEIYPATDSFTANGHKFGVSRGLRVNKTKCRLEFNKIILEGEFSLNDVIEATKFDIAQRKALSGRSGDNKLTFLQNSATYLNQRSFEPFILLLKKEGKSLKLEIDNNNNNETKFSI